VVVREDGRADETADLFAGDQEFDDLGFVRPPPGDAVGDRDREYAAWFQAKAERRRRRFESARRGMAEPGVWTSLPTAKLKLLLRKGLPKESRAEVWWDVLGCEARRRSSPSGYEPEKAAALVRQQTLEEIERDLERTFPNHDVFRRSAGRGQLRNVLRAFAVHYPRVQYCQGLNYIAAMMLVVFPDEERAFWALVCSVERLGVEHYYTDGMRLLRADIDVFEIVLAKKCPKVYQIIQKHDVQVKSVCTEWFVTWFAKALPSHTVLRVWDTLFFEGFKVLFRVALGIFKRVEPEVRQCDSFEAIMERAKKWARCMVEHNELLKASFRGIPSFRRADLTQARDATLARLEAEDEQRHRQREARSRSHRGS
jgi:hypothetical protein